MLKNRGFHIVFLLLIASLVLVASITAQDDTAGSLTVGVPVSAQIAADGETIRFDYALDQPATITLQAFSENVQPTLSILRDGEVVAVDANDSGGLVVTLDAVLTGGAYVVEVGSTGATTGLIIVVLQSETPINIIDLPFAVTMRDAVDASNPVIIYRFTALTERSFLDVESDADDRGVTVRLFNETDNRVSGAFSPDLPGGRFYIAANGADYRLEIAHDDADAGQSFRVCWSVTDFGCDIDDAAPFPPVDACTVTPSASAVNIRASASVASSIVGTLSVGQFAPVLGIDPDGAFYNIQHGGIDGWVATGVVMAGGDCDGVAVIVPPPFTAPVEEPTAPPTSEVTAPPPTPDASGTATYTPSYTPTSGPTSTPTYTPTSGPSGPCLLTVNSPVFVYVVPVAVIDDLFDQVQMGELIPIGRLADNSWWLLNYGNSWIETSYFGNAITVSGDCSGLPVVSAP